MGRVSIRVRACVFGSLFCLFWLTVLHSLKHLRFKTRTVNFLLYVSVFLKRLCWPAQEKIIYKFLEFSTLKSEPQGRCFLILDENFYQLLEVGFQDPSEEP